jgi:hypothetical protein
MSEFERRVVESSPHARSVRCTVILGVLTVLYVAAIGSLAPHGATGRTHRSNSASSISMHPPNDGRSRCAYDAEPSSISLPSADHTRRTEGQVTTAALEDDPVDR